MFKHNRPLYKMVLIQRSRALCLNVLVWMRTCSLDSTLIISAISNFQVSFKGCAFGCGGDVVLLIAPAQGMGQCLSHGHGKTGWGNSWWWRSRAFVRRRLDWKMCQEDPGGNSRCVVRYCVGCEILVVCYIMHWGSPWSRLPKVYISDDRDEAAIQTEHDA